MTDPQTPGEYRLRFEVSQRVERRGMGFVNVVPCPFCAAPGFAEWRLEPGRLDRDMARARVCGECRRGARVVKIQLPGQPTQRQTVQTEGPDPPLWMLAPDGPGWPVRE